VTSVQSITGDLGGADCLIQIYGRNLGKKYDLYDPVVTIGRDPRNTIVLDSDSVSRRHAMVELCDSGRMLRDAGSTNGTYMNDIQVKSAILSNGDFIKVGDTIFKYLSGSNIESMYHEEIYNMTIRDGLTQIPNKRFLQDHLEKEFSRAKRYGRQLAVLIFDIDHFKKVNDTFGHLSGDHVLKEMATILMRRVRKEEMFARYGGEEFVLVLPESPREDGIRFAEILRTIVAEHEFEFDGHPIRITISVGVAVITEDMETVSDLLKVADDNLYKAKNGGRNRVEG
jgi:diguanylate cyclase (GGDEF)-like protein